MPQQQLYREAPQQQQVIEAQTITSHRACTFTTSEVEDLFAITGNVISRAAQRLVHLRDKNRLEKLQLSFDECKTLFRDKRISIENLESYIKDLKMTFNQILLLRGTYNLWPLEVKELVKINFSVDEIIRLMESGLTKNEIKRLGYFVDRKITVGQILVFQTNHVLFSCELKSILDRNVPADGIVELLNESLTIDEIMCLVIEKLQTPANILHLLTYVDKTDLLSLDAHSISFVLKVMEICKMSHDSVDVSLKSFEAIYRSIPKSCVESLVQTAEQLFDNGGESGFPMMTKATTKSLEEILKYYMDLASGEVIKVAGYSDLVSTSFNKIIKIIGKISRSKNNDIVKLFPVKPYLLAVIWLAMIIQIEGKHLEVTSATKEEIAKAVFSILIALLIGVTGFFHSGGTGLEPINPTAYIASYFKIQKTLEENCKGIYAKIPEKLKIKTNECFENLSKEKQLSAGLALSMAYTFRIGDNMINSLANENVFSFDAVKKVFKSMWPLPSPSESKRMYFVYSGYSIYTSIDMSDVFVLVPAKFV